MTSKSGGLRLSREVLNVIVAADQHQHLPQLEPLSKFDKFEAGTLSATKSSTSRQRDLGLNKTTCIHISSKANSSEPQDVDTRPGCLRLPDVVYVRRKASQWLNGHVFTTRQPREDLLLV
jgi:hypothetical protein